MNIIAPSEEDSDEFVINSAIIVKRQPVFSSHTNILCLQEKKDFFAQDSNAG